MMMNDFRFYHKDFLLGFIQVYQDLPCLWQIKHPEYHNKDKKNKGFEILIKKMKEIEPRADRNSVANKISNLRSVYKRECKRLLKLHPNKNPEDLISENIWYFEHLHFLQDQKQRNGATATATAAGAGVAAKATNSKSKARTTATTTTATTTTATTATITTTADIAAAATLPVEESVEQSQVVTNTRKRKAETAAYIVADGDDESYAKLAKLLSSNTNEESAVKIEKDDKPDDLIPEPVLQENEVLLPDLILKTEPDDVTADDENFNYDCDREDSDDLLSEIGASTFNSDHMPSERGERIQSFELMERNNFDRFDHMTSAWAGIIRNLPRSQQIFAEKLINDVMFEAQLENLSRQSVVIASNSQKNKQNGVGHE